jgi:hypothetical protein
MPKKSTQWVTIPEASLHTPASEARKASASKSDSPDRVKNKLFWGIGFVVLLVAAFAVMAPAQFSQLLKGSLFDTAGVSPDQTTGVINPLNLLPTATKEETAPAETTTPAPEATTPPADQPAPETTTPPSAEPVVTPEEQPTTIAVQPISTPEEVKVEPVGTGSTDCKADVTCLLPHLADCSLAKGTFAYSVMGQSVEANLEITGVEGDNCLVKAVITKIPQADLVGKDATCKLPKGSYTQDSLQATFSDVSKLAAACSGSAVDSLKGYLGTLSAVSSQAQMVQQLMQQVQQLQQAQLQGTRPSAPETTLPTQTNPSTLQPGFRENPYRVTISPEQMLRQNAAGGVPQYSNVSIGSYQPAPATQPTYQYQPVTGKKTPQTGPETTALALFVAFVALVSWKFMRTFAR